MVAKISFGLCLIGFAFAFFSCNLTSNGKTTQTVTFNSLYDSIKTDDSALIVFKTEDGKLLDTVFHGRIINKAGFANLPVANWEGGLVVIFITVYKENKIVFQYERHVDGKTNQTTKSFITVAYHNGVDTTKVIPVDTTKKLPIDTTKNPTIDTTKVKPPDTTTQVHSDGINVSPRILKLYTGGEVLALTAKLLPVTISQKVKWMSTNPTIAKVDDSGKVTPVAPGNVKVYATSLADTSKRDSADVTVKRDAPQVSVGQDTVVSLGKTVEFLPVVAPQEYGLVTTFKWDLNGDGTWDDSSAAVKLISYKYDQDKEYLVRFYVRDTEGNETIVTKKVKTSSGPIVLIKSPLNNSYTNKRTVAIVWSINDAIQDSLNTQVLKDSVNTITRTAYDAAKKPFSSSITIYFDSIPPNKPLVHGNGLTSSLTPSWSWVSGGAGGNGFFRWAMDLEVFTSSPEIKDTLYTPTVPLTEGVHTLYVQERDNADNWSASGTLAIKIDKTPPAKPVVKVTEGGLTNVVKPTFTWASAGGGGNGSYQWKLDNQDLSFGATTTTDFSYLTVSALTSGQHTMYVRERDSTGNWSDLGSVQVTVDVDPPSAPILLGTTPTSSAPTWTWTTGGNGGSGDFRYKQSDANFTLANTPGKDLTYSVSGAATGNSYTLFVEEKDAAGNWSLPASKTIVYDLSKPTVTIKLPQSSGTYLTSASTVDVSGTCESPQGAGAIKSVTYTLDGIAGTLTTNLIGATGAWSIKAVPLVNNKTIVIKVTATDALGSGDASLSLSMDNTPPSPPVFSTQPLAALNNLNAPTSLQWTWSRTGDATDSFLVSLNGNIVSRQTGVSYSIPIPSSSSMDGTFQLQVVEKDLAGNISGSTSSTAAVLDRAAPNAPTMNSLLSPAKTATWTWVSGGGNGSGKYQCQLDNGNISLCISAFVLPLLSLTDGDHTLKVQELDAVGNLSNWSSSTMTIDLVPPILTLNNYSTVPSQIFNSIQAVSATVTDTSFKYVQYQIGSTGTWMTAVNSGTTWTFTPALDTGTQTVNIRAEDKAGNQTIKTLQLTYEPSVIFVLKDISTGTHDGSSWANANSDLGPLLIVDKGFSNLKQIWVSEGAYTPSTIDGFFFKPNISIIGAFAKDGSNRKLSERNLSTQYSILNTYPGSARIISTPSNYVGGTKVYTDGIVLADFVLQNGGNSTNQDLVAINISGSNSATLKNITLASWQGFEGMFFSNAKVDISDSHFSYGTVNDGIIYAAPASSIRIMNTEIIDIGHQPYYGAVTVWGWTSICIGGSKTKITDSKLYNIQFDGAFTYEQAISIDLTKLSPQKWHQTDPLGTATQVTSCPAPF